MSSPEISTPPAKEVALSLLQSLPGTQVHTAGTDIPPELLLYGPAETGEILEVMKDDRVKVKIVMTTLVGMPYERIQVLDEGEDTLLAAEVREALGIQ